jgi:tetratricopeptide (TPR) repeat protein
MQQAVQQSGNSRILRQSAEGNLADLYLHDGQTRRAASLYQAILSDNPAEAHAWKGLARIVLLRDHDPLLADTILLSYARHYALPDPWYDRISVAEERKDTAQAREYAAFFAEKAGDSVYGNMYNRYLIDVYTGLLHQPQKALALAEKEMQGRATPQTWCWLAWAQHCAGMDATAKETYRLHVSGKPLEAPELYQMGMLMKETGRDGQATAYFKAALQNRYDLSPFKVSDCLNWQK